MATVNEYFRIISSTIAKCDIATSADRDEIYRSARAVVQEQLDWADMDHERHRRDDESAKLNAAIHEIENTFSTRHGLIIATAEMNASAANEINFQRSAAGEDIDESPAEVSSNSGAMSKMGQSRQFAANVGAGTVVNIIRVLFQLVSLPILARILTPSDYGVYALALPTVSLFMMLADGGLGVSLARESEDNRILWSTAFWTLLATCSLMGVLVCASGFVLAWISGESVLIGLMAFLSAALPLLAFTVVADARLIRRGNLIYHCAADLCGLITGAATGLFVAFHGGGAWSLAAQFVSSLAIRAIMLNLAARSRPYFEFEFSSLAEHVSIGGWLLMMRISDTVGRIVENSFFGRFFGPELLGSYTLALQLVRFSCESVTNPILSAFYAHAVRHQQSDVGRMHLFLSRVILTILIPFAVILSILAPKILPLILGDQWNHAAAFVRILIVPYAIAGASWLSGQVLLKNGIVARNTLINVLINIFRVISIFCGILLDSLTIAWLLAASYVIQAVALTVAVPDGLGAAKNDLLNTFALILLSSSLAGIFVYALDSLGGEGWLTFATEISLGGLVYLFSLFLLMRNTFRNDYYSLMNFIRPS
ncbi:oligosaccharide flippase family protein [Methylobacterium sp. E-005]|uniref:oligosaccharide flippase family protein n=1 Tax=Methylobacterium sp. E-005 TaxID=2836549 RepID=UPI001FB87EE6|nr:oligosaccharide flippase family protein [Methylobacterium sp. E-005]MCJ2089598.1 oligosaccharide flippase family protein [Methylobacterium sp. E-005]